MKFMSPWKNVGFRLWLCSFVVRCYPDFTCIQGSFDPTSLEHKPFSFYSYRSVGPKQKFDWEEWKRWFHSFCEQTVIHSSCFIPTFTPWLIVTWSPEPRELWLYCLGLALQNLPRIRVLFCWLGKLFLIHMLFSFNRFVSKFYILISITS